MTAVCPTRALRALPTDWEHDYGLQVPLRFHTSTLPVEIRGGRHGHYASFVPLLPEAPLRAYTTPWGSHQMIESGSLSVYAQRTRQLRRSEGRATGTASGAAAARVEERSDGSRLREGTGTSDRTPPLAQQLSIEERSDELRSLELRRSGS